jgi:hypothetical protein
MIDLNAQSILKIESSVAQNPRASWWALNCALSLRVQVPLGKKRVKKVMDCRDIRIQRAAA